MKSQGDVIRVLRANYSIEIRRKNSIISIYDRLLKDISKYISTSYKYDSYTIYKTIDEMILNAKKNILEYKKWKEEIYTC